MTLTDLAIKYSCDKYYRHSYLPVYEHVLGERQVKRLLEIGIGYKDLMQPFLPEGIEYVHGSSLKMWSEYWPDAEIWACDIREDTMVTEGNIRSVVRDQSSPLSLLSLVGQAKGNFDVIIDDGSHQFEHQLLTAVTLLPYLAVGGVYMIEDTYADKGEVLRRKFGGKLYVGRKTPDDCLLVIGG